MHLFESISRILRAQRHLTQVLGRDPTNEELALEVGYLSASDVQMILRAHAEGQTDYRRIAKRLDTAIAKNSIACLRSAEEPVSLGGPVGDEEFELAGRFHRR